MLTVGVVLCGHLVDSVSEEQSWLCPPEMRRNVSIFRLQFEATVNDQHFGTYAIFNPEDNPDLRSPSYTGTNDSAK